MIIDKKEKYTFVSSAKESFEEFYTAFRKNYPKFAKEHLLIQLSDFLNITDAEILVFLDFRNQHKKNGTTFVVIHTNVTIDNFPEDFNIVPTLLEAEDILEMENIERALGF